MSVTSKLESVDELVGKSPLHYDLVTPAARGSVATFLTNWPSGTITSRPQIFPHEASSSSSTPEFHDEAASDSGSYLDRRGFTLHIWPAAKYWHQRAILCSPLYGAWDKDDRRVNVFPTLESPIAAALRAALPRDAAFNGLSDWESYGQLDHDKPLRGYDRRSGRRPHPIPALNGLTTLGKATVSERRDAGRPPADEREDQRQVTRNTPDD